MPIIKGTMGYTRFLLNAERPMPVDDIAERLNLFKFRALHDRGEDMESFGWVSYGSEFEWDQPIEISDFYFDRAVVLCARIDKITLPKALLKALVKKSIAAYAKEHQKTPDKTVRQEIQLAETLGLRSRMLPHTTLIEAIWLKDAGELRVFSRSKTKLDRFVELFEQTMMQRPLRHDFAYGAWQLAKVRHEDTALERLTHQPLFIPPIRIDVQ